MSAYVLPGFWLLLGVLGTVGWLVAARPVALEKRDSHQLAAARRTAGSRLLVVLDAAIAMLCLVGGASALWSGSTVWWLWLLAALAQVTATVSRRRAAVAFDAARLGAPPAPPTPPAPPSRERRQRHVLVFSTVAAVLFVVGRVVLAAAGNDGSDARDVVGSVLVLLAVGAALAAGWAAVWQFRDERDRTAQE